LTKDSRTFGAFWNATTGFLDGKKAEKGGGEGCFGCRLRQIAVLYAAFCTARDGKLPTKMRHIGDQNDAYCIHEGLL